MPAAHAKRSAPSFTIDVYRTGYYQGIGARRVASLGSFPGLHQAIPLPDPQTGKVECHWTKTTTLTTNASTGGLAGPITDSATLHGFRDVAARLPCSRVKV